MLIQHYVRHVYLGRYRWVRSGFDARRGGKRDRGWRDCDIDVREYSKKHSNKTFITIISHHHQQHHHPQQHHVIHIKTAVHFTIYRNSWWISFVHPHRTYSFFSSVLFFSFPLPLLLALPFPVLGPVFWLPVLLPPVLFIPVRILPVFWTPVLGLREAKYKQRICVDICIWSTTSHMRHVGTVRNENAIELSKSTLTIFRRQVL